MQAAFRHYSRALETSKAVVEELGGVNGMRIVVLAVALAGGGAEDEGDE